MNFMVATVASDNILRGKNCHIRLDCEQKKNERHKVFMIKSNNMQLVWKATIFTTAIGMPI